MLCSSLGHRPLQSKQGDPQLCKHVFALLAAFDAIGQHSTARVFPLQFRRKGLGNHDKSTPTHFFEKDATNLTWPEVIDGLFAVVEKKRKYVQGYNKFQSEIPLTKKQKKEVESAKPIEEKIFVQMTVPQLKDALKNNFSVNPKSSVRKAELVEMAVAEFRKRGNVMEATPTTVPSSTPPPVNSRAPSQPLSRPPQSPLSPHQEFAAQLSLLSPNRCPVLNSNSSSLNNATESMDVEDPPTPPSKLIVRITVPKK